MQKAPRAQTAIKTSRTGAQPAAARKTPTTTTTSPQPIDLKTLERVGGGWVELPHKYW